MGTGTPKRSGWDSVTIERCTFRGKLTGAAADLVPHGAKPPPLPPPSPAAGPMFSLLLSCPLLPSAAPAGRFARVGRQ